jgi:hypothetical protein
MNNPYPYWKSSKKIIVLLFCFSVSLGSAKRSLLCPSALGKMPKSVRILFPCTFLSLMVAIAGKMIPKENEIIFATHWT